MTDQILEVQGLREINDTLTKLPQRMAKRVVRNAMNAGARIIRDRAKALAPVGKTGALKRNIVSKRGLRRYDDGLEARLIIGVRHGKVRDAPTTYITKTGKKKVRKLTAYDKRKQDPYYFRFQELGYTQRDGTKVDGKKFLQNALDQSGQRAINKVRDVARSEIEKGALKNER